jgi:hypothetical protein
MQDTTQSRLLKVYPRNVCKRYCPTRTDPQIKFSGQWLNRAGFLPDMPIQIKVTRHRLVIIPMEEKSMET